MPPIPTARQWRRHAAPILRGRGHAEGGSCSSRGLDECDRQSQKTVLKFIKSSQKESARLKTIISSRPQEQVLAQLAGSFRINLVSDLHRDSILALHMVENQLCYLSEDVKKLVVKVLSPMAQGSAIWLRMVIELIERRQIRACRPMQAFLGDGSLPMQLTRLYAVLLSRCTLDDLGNRNLAETALKLLAVARRPLSISELAWAVALAVAGPDVNTVAGLEELVDHQRVLSLISPFISLIDFADIDKRQVRLLHQSVKEFMSRDLPSQQIQIRDTFQRTHNRDIQHLDIWACGICMRYLLLDEIGQIDLFTEEQAAIEELPQEDGLFDDDLNPVEYDPSCTWETWEEEMIHFDPKERGFGGFFAYGSCYWVEHLATDTLESLTCLALIEELCQAGSTRLHNWIQQYRRPGCTIQPRFQFQDELYDLLSIVCLYGSTSVLMHMLEESDFTKEAYLPPSAIKAADQILQWGDLSRLELLALDHRVGYQPRNLSFFRSIIRQWFFRDERCRDWDAVFRLVNRMLETMERDSWMKELSFVALEAGCQPIIECLRSLA
ncbi:hypothetical protein LTR22_024108 [Elasticomyces elasticus]|nr:hypothetical protein LTR22_024108 [Elasticomyces elasticus]KAK4906233.1 hypothetical protein LTR49_024596 [Elasticomyces elasticus]KAK5744693.1 hypothetical protein LTS12_023372 [Elasticomyces elasticus]